MSRLSVADLRFPLPEYRPDWAPPCERKGHSFETTGEARAEDLERAGFIRVACRSPDVPFDREVALKLAADLQRSGAGLFDLKSMASKVYMGRKRISIGGALWHLVDKGEGYNTFSVRPRGWLFTVEELAALDPRRMIQQFRSAINRQRGERHLGFLIASIHGEFDEASGLYEPHFHGIADDGMLNVVDELRHLQDFRSSKKLGERPRVVVGRQPLNNLPYPLTYRFQSSWPKRWRGEIEGVEERGNVRHRIPEPYHTALLLWLDRWRLSDITLLMGAYVGRDGFVLRVQNDGGERT